MSNDLEARVNRLEDIDAVVRLTSTYALYVNKGWNGEVVDFDRLVEVFAEDATWTSAAMNVDAKGHNDIVAMLREATAAGTFSMHSFSNPIIEVHGDVATGNWLLWVAVNSEDGPANQVYQSEDLDYVRTPEGWRIQHLNLHFGQMLLAG